MPEFYVPSTKKELLEIIRKYYWNAGQSFAGLEKKSKKMLYAIFYEIRGKQGFNNNHGGHK